MVIESIETQLRRSRRLANMAGVAPTNAEVVTITLPAKLCRLVLQFFSGENGQAKR